eukprot:762767-Hanusia_phi.AAC.2
MQTQHMKKDTSSIIQSSPTAQFNNTTYILPCVSVQNVNPAHRKNITCVNNRPLSAQIKKTTYLLPCDFRPKCKSSTCKNNRMSVQSSPERAVCKRILTHYHAISVKQATQNMQTVKSCVSQSSPERTIQAHRAYLVISDVIFFILPTPFARAVDIKHKKLKA